MANQTINLGVAPTGAGGDTFRSAAAKINENFSNPAHAASRFVGEDSGNLMIVGAFGVGGSFVTLPMPSDSTQLGSGFYYFDVGGSGSTWQQVETNVFVMRGSFYDKARGFELGCLPYSNKFYLRSSAGEGTTWQTPVLIRHSGNTTTDSNGFIKAASPIIQLYADKIEINEDAIQQNPTFEKINTGHYLIKNTEGFSDNGWYIEMPKDANGNVLVAVQYQQLEDNTIEVKTFSKKFDEETGDIIPNIDKPRDIPVGRWIDLRLKELPKPEIEVINEPEQ